MALSRTTRIIILLIVDSIFFLVELILGYIVGSLALVADSFHMLNDVLSLLVALYAIRLTAKHRVTDSDTKYSYGWHRAEILAALVNGVFLLALCFSIFMEALQRFFSKPEISNPKLVVIVGCIGLASNVFGLFLFHEHDHGKATQMSSETTENDERAKTITGGNDIPLGEATPRGQSREVSDSLFGHPVATRAYVIQEAQTLQEAQSPSVVSGSHRSSTSSYNDDRLRPGLEVQASIGLYASSNGRTSLERHGSGLLGVVPKPTTVQDDSAPDSKSIDSVVHRSSKKGAKAGSMNVRALVLHVIGDALGNVGVIASGLVIWLSHLSWKNYFDPIISLVITVIIFSSALPLVKSASFILLQGVPSDISLQEVDKAILEVEGVLGVHELHIWQLSESRVVASVHVRAAREHDFMKIAAEVRKLLHDRGIHSSTIQPEYFHPNQSQASSASLHTNKNGYCLITCPPDQQDCDPIEHSCCPPTSASV